MAAGLGAQAKAHTGPDRCVQIVGAGEAEARIAEDRVMPVPCGGQPEYAARFRRTIADGADVGGADFRCQRPFPPAGMA